MQAAFLFLGLVGSILASSMLAPKAPKAPAPAPIVPPPEPAPIPEAPKPIEEPVVQETDVLLNEKERSRSVKRGQSALQPNLLDLENNKATKLAYKSLLGG